MPLEMKATINTNNIELRINDKLTTKLVNDFPIFFRLFFKKNGRHTHIYPRLDDGIKNENEKKNTQSRKIAIS